MKAVKDDDKVVGPLFPRLHVNDADKGGPRAPPRNKMALYEQFSIPSQRFNSASSAVPLPPHNSSNLVPSLSSSQGFGHQRNMFPSFYMTSQVPVHSAEIVTRTSDGVNHGATMTGFERKSAKQVNSGNLFGIGSAAECSSQQPHNPIVKNSSAKTFDDADDIIVPTFDQPEVLASKKDPHIKGPGRLTSFSSQQMQKIPAAINSSVQCLNSNEKTLEHTDISGNKIRDFNRNHIGKNHKETSPVEKPKEPNENPPSHRATEVSNGSKDSLARSEKRNLHFTEKSVSRNMVLCPENVDLCEAQPLNDNAISSDCEAMKARSRLCPKASSEKHHRTTILFGNCQKEDSAKENGSVVFEDGERKDDTSEPSMVETVSGVVISPDDIVEVIGPKHFWKARRAIINQQRVFAIQVFELHRLIKVQKLIAASPHILLEGNPYLSKPPAKAPSKTLLPRCKNSQQEESRPEDDFQKQNGEQPAEDFAGVPALPPCEDGYQGGQQVQVPTLVPNSGIPSSLPMAPDDKPGSPWCFPPMANQWLVPVMSPSEGLVYKPYSGPCPPSGAFVTPLYGGCTPLGVSHVAGDFMNPAYGLSASHRPPNMAVLSGPPAVASNYFPTPYGLRPMNPMISTSAVEQVSNLANGQTGQHSGSSCNMSHHPRKEPFSGHLRKFQLSKNSELQGSTASSPSEKEQPAGRNPLPPLPTAPAANSLNCPSQSSGRDSKTRVIKVVPHNARSATESAARIFRSIQEERQQHDS